MRAVLVFIFALVAAPPTRWVTDNAGMLSPAAVERLDNRLEAYEQSTGHQVVVWIGDTLGQEPLDDWAVRTFQQWGLGRKGQDDGVALFIFKSDHTIDIEVGYGLEGQVPDAVASRIIREDMTPRLRAGDADGAVEAGVDALLGAIGGEGQAARPASSSGRLPIGPIIIGVILLLAFLFNPRLATMMLWSMAGRGGFGGGGFGGGGFGGGGGGGGFSGRGGRSGGGGARGSW